MAQDNSRIDCSDIHPGALELRRTSSRQGVGEPDNLPFMLCPPGAKTAALLVHGFTGTPWEMRLLGEHLAKSGIASLAVRLPGHGTSPKDLAGRRWEEWYDAALEGYQILTSEFPSIYGMGMSTGCLVLLAMARANPLSGLALFSPYLRIQHWLAPYAGVLRWVRSYQVKAEGDRQDKHYYHRRPIAGIHQINRLLRVVRGQLSQVNCPVLAFNGEGDVTVDIASGRQLVDSLGSAVRIHLKYGPDVPHVLTREENPCHQAMFAQATRFVQELESPGAIVRVR